MAKKIEVKKEGRKCKDCTKTLSIYNPKNICFSCQEIRSGKAQYNKKIEGLCTSNTPTGIVEITYDYNGYINYEDY